MKKKIRLSVLRYKIILFVVFFVFSMNLNAQNETNCAAATGLSVLSKAANSVKIGYTLPAGITSATLQIVTAATAKNETTAWLTKTITIPSSYTERGELLSGTVYVYRIKTVCSNGTEKYSSLGEFTTLASTTASCSAAASVTASNITSTSVKINFKLPADVTEASLELLAANSSTSLSKPITSLTATSIERVELTPSTKYTFKIKTKCANGVVNYSAPGNFTTLTSSTATETCSAATGLSVLIKAANSVKIGYTLPAGITSATLQIVTAATAINEATAWMTKTITIPSSYTERGELLSGTVYVYRIKTVCSNGTEKYSSLGEFTTLASNTATCSAAASVTASNITSTSVKINFKLPADVTEASLELYAATSSTSLSKSIASLTATSIERVELTPSTKYIFKIKTKCANGVVNYSAIGDFTTLAATTSTCTAATNIVVSNITANSAKFDYKLPTGITSATLEIIPANAIAWFPRSLLITSTSYERNELMQATKYYYRIRTVCANGTVSYSPEAYFITLGNKSGSLTMESTSGQNADDLTLACFPNPATTEITVNILGVEGQMVDLQLSNINGKVVFQSKYAQNVIPKIDVSSLPRGFYILKASASGKINSLKIVLN